MLKKTTSILLTLLMTASLTACNKNTGPNPVAVIETSKGTIEAEIFANEIPELSKNFIELAKQGKYDNVPFHRVIKNFMIQTGDFTNKNGTGGHSYKGLGVDLPGEFDEAVSSNVRGTLSMANRGPNTNGSQFFINLVDNTFLNHDEEPISSQHPVFGRVVKGMEVVDAIGNAQTVNDAPVEEIFMTKVTIRE
ncbi:MAG: peptidylprolyl isomerase [Candidatus Altimarinota bacterium]